ncbi:hypothetical protein FE257_004048 [Aspergillus nanangensis]|uniref:Zn(2)-C6 fungal-type domain-containing protein n=1 Tax=Aspergillus nanangensis TaxID=2582783 RepID=A0AAD4CBF7_ASPNN|nr:hypothetical protein FE257_004048 [Aspergillus nanangensis]
MASPSFLENPLLKVSRPVAACSRCRTAKIKCDGKLPACSACERVGKANTCSGASDEFARGKERSYVASLEGYCERLEQKIATLRQRKEALAVNGGGSVQESSITSAASDPVSHAHRKEVSDIDDLVGDFGFLSVNATSRDFHGISSSASFANLLLSLSLVEPLQRSLSPLPPRHEILPLLQFYFENFYPQLPFFDETSFWASVENIYQKDGRFAKPSDHWFLRLILAISSVSASYQIGDRCSQRALSFVSGALQYADDVLRPGSVLGIQAILLLAQYALMDFKHFRPWYIVGMAVRVMVDLGVHQDPPPEVLPATERLDMRRRVFHCVYSLDRGLSTAIERTFSLSDDSVNVALPIMSNSMSSPIFSHNSAPAWHLVKIRQILSLAYQKKYHYDHDYSPQSSQSTWELCQKSREWLNEVPTNAPEFFPRLCRLEFVYTIIMILSPTGTSSILCDYTKVLLFDHCIHFVADLHRVLEGPDWLPLMTSLDIQRAFQVSRRLTDLLCHDYDVVMDVLQPEQPVVPPDAHGPPGLCVEDRINCHSRAIDFLNHTQNLLQFGAGKWGMDLIFKAFQEDSEYVRKRLMQPSVPYYLGTETYLPRPPTTVPPSGTEHVGYEFVGQFGQ